MLTHFLRERKAVSTIISAVLLVSIASLAIAVVYSWNVGLIQQWSGWTQAESSGHLKRILITDVSPQTAGTTSLTIKIQNKGGENETLDTIFVSDETTGGQVAAFKNLSTNIPMNQPSVSVPVQLTTSLVQGHQYQVKVACKSGATAEYIFIAR